jgi:hypothetical protein
MGDRTTHDEAKHKEREKNAQRRGYIGPDPGFKLRRLEICLNVPNAATGASRQHSTKCAV